MTSARLVIRPDDTSTPRDAIVVELPTDWNGTIRITASPLRCSSSVDRVMEWFTSRNLERDGADPGLLSPPVSIAVESFIPSAADTAPSAVRPVETLSIRPAWQPSTQHENFSDLIADAVSHYQAQLEQDLKATMDSEIQAEIVGLLDEIQEYHDATQPNA